MPSPEPLPPLFDEFPPIPDEEWEAKIEADLGTATTDEALRWDSIDGLSLPAYLRRDDRDALPHTPTGGTTPPLANADPTPSNGWRIRQDLWHADLDEARALAETALRGGVTDLGLILDSSSGTDAGLPIETPEDLATLLRDLLPANTSLHLDHGPGAVVLLSGLLYLRDNSTLNEMLRGTVGYDPVAALARGGLSDENAAFNLTDDLLSASPQSLRSLSLDLRPYHEAGASAVQELAFGLGALTETLSQLLDRGRTLDEILPRLHVQTSVSTSYFVEMAKLRALRLLVPQVIEAFSDEAEQPVEFGPTDLFVQAETSPRTETLYDPHVNMLRGTTEAMAAVLGGCDVLNVRPYDACFQSPSAFGTRIARNVQLILEHEAHFDVVADPAAGAYYVETTTDQLAERAWERFQTLEADGSILKGLKQETIQADIASVREQRQQEIDDRTRVLVGTNHYPNLEEQRLGDTRLDASPCNNGITEPDELSDLSLEGLQAALQDGRSMLELVVGLREGPSSIAPLPRLRLARNLEELRLRTEQYAESEGTPPTVLLAPLGPPGPRSTRATFARNVFGVAGFDIVEPLMFESVEEVAAEADESGADIVVLCSADDAYSDLAPTLQAALAGYDLSPLLVIAGNPDDLDADLPADDFIHRGNLLRKKLEAFQDRLGIAE